MAIVAVACPRFIWTAFTSALAAMSSEAAVWQRSWIVVPASPTDCVVSVQRERTRRLVLVQIAPVGLGANALPPGRDRADPLPLGTVILIPASWVDRELAVTGEFAPLLNAQAEVLSCGTPQAAIAANEVVASATQYLQAATVLTSKQRALKGVIPWKPTEEQDRVVGERLARTGLAIQAFITIV